MNHYITEKVNIIKRSAEILMEHYATRGFKNTLTETALNNIIGMCKSILEEIEKEKAPETPRE